MSGGPCFQFPVHRYRPRGIEGDRGWGNAPGPQENVEEPYVVRCCPVRRRERIVVGGWQGSREMR